MNNRYSMSFFDSVKLWFIPHKHNKHHPKILNFWGMTIVLSTVLLIIVGYNLSVANKLNVLGFETNISQEKIIQLINESREQVGSPKLIVNSHLQAAAYSRAKDIISQNYWSHTAPNGKQAWDFINNNGYQYEVAGENLARDFKTDHGVVSGWLKSSSHAENMLNKKYQEIGLAVVDGELNGQNTTIVVALFAKPRMSSVPSLTPVAQAQSENSYSLVNPLLSTKIFGWGARLVILVLAIALLVYVNAHIYRSRKKIRHHKLTYSLPQALILTILIILIITSSFGSVL